MKNLYQVFNKELAKEFGLVGALILQCVLDRIEIRARVEAEEPTFDQAVIFTIAEIEDKLGYLNLEALKREMASLKDKEQIDVDFLYSHTESLAAISLKIINPERYRDYLFALPDPHDD